jgi:Protein DA1/LIM domain
MPTNSTEDDEALARMLQFEEQGGGGGAVRHRRSGSSSDGGGGGNARQETAQEQQDMELARQFAQMEMQQQQSSGGGGGDVVSSGIHSPTNRRRSATHDGAFDVFSAFAEEDAAAAAAMPAPPRSPPRSPRRSSYVDSYHGGSSFASSSLQQQQHHQQQQEAQLRRTGSPYAQQDFRHHHNRSASDFEFRHPSDMSPPPPSRQTPPRSSSSNSSGGGGAAAAAAFNQLAYARQLQQHAFSNIRRGDGGYDMPDLGGRGVTTTQDSDLELARRMQELEDIGMGRVNSEREGGGRDGDGGDSRHAYAVAAAEAAAAAAAASHHQHHGASGSGDGGAPGTAVCVPPDHLRGGTADERLARFLEATGRSLRDISREEMNIVTGQLQQRSHHPTRQRFSDQHQDMATVREIHVGPTERPGVRVLLPSSATPSSPGNRSRTAAAAASPYTHFTVPTTPVRPRGSSVGSKSPKETDDLYDVPDSMVQQVNTAEGAQQHRDAAVPDRKKKTRNFLGNFLNLGDRKPPPHGAGGIAAAAGIPPPDLACIPAAIPPASMSIRGSGGGAGGGGIPSAIPLLDYGRGIPAPNRREFPSQGRGGTIAPCVACGLTTGSFIVALEQKYHPDCFRCAACHERIDVLEPFAVSRDSHGRKEGYHRKCFAEIVGARCAVCRLVIPANDDGTVSFVKHPFFDAEQMCPGHAGDNVRRCTGCHRFEPVDDPFVDLKDAGRCVCYACCRTVIMSSSDVTPLWKQVLAFFEHQLGLPIWDGMRNIPVMIVGANELNDQLAYGNNVHYGSTQIMTRGLCLTHHDHRNAGLRFKLPSMRFNQSLSSFEALDAKKDGFTYYEVPRGVASNSAANVYAIMCMSGLPRDLTASILAHEALHAWVKLHPQYDARRPIPAQVEEGCCQLISMLFLNDGLDDPQPLQSGEPGPSDAKLRQYFRFCIETDDSDIYGTGYRRAAGAYSEIGIEALLMHIVLYRDFPQT